MAKLLTTMGRLVTGTLSVDPAAAATKRQIRDLETAYRRQSRSLDRAARKGNLAAGSERIRLIQDAMNRGVDATRFGSSEQRGAARDSMAQNLYGEARDMAQSGVASAELRNQDLNARMDDFVRSNGGNVGGYTPAARAEYDGLRREAMALAGGFRRASGLGAQGADSTSQVSLPRKPGQLPKGTAPDLTTTDQQLKPDAKATGDPSKESGTFAKLTEQQKGIEAGAKNVAQQEAKRADVFDPAQAKAKRQADVQKLMDRSKQLLIEHSRPSMTDESGQGLYQTEQIERSMRQSAMARGAPTKDGSTELQVSKFLDRPQELGGRDGYVQKIASLDPTQRQLQTRKDGLSPIEQTLVEGRLAIADKRKAMQGTDQWAAAGFMVPSRAIQTPNAAPVSQVAQPASLPGLVLPNQFNVNAAQAGQTTLAGFDEIPPSPPLPMPDLASLPPTRTSVVPTLPYRLGSAARNIVSAGQFAVSQLQAPGADLAVTGAPSAAYPQTAQSFTAEAGPMVADALRAAKKDLSAESQATDAAVAKILERLKRADKKLNAEFARGYARK